MENGFHDVQLHFFNEAIKIKNFIVFGEKKSEFTTYKVKPSKHFVKKCCSQNWLIFIQQRFLDYGFSDSRNVSDVEKCIAKYFL